jgi:uncharacterized protein YllA (UPF0747 family)
MSDGHFSEGNKSISRSLTRNHFCAPAYHACENVTGVHSRKSSKLDHASWMRKCIFDNHQPQPIDQPRKKTNYHKIAIHFVFNARPYPYGYILYHGEEYEQEKWQTRQVAAVFTPATEDHSRSQW